MALVGVDDTDSRTGGMCTTWIGMEIARRLPADANPTTYLIRLHPAVPHKTRGNGAIAVAAEGPAQSLLAVATAVIDEYAVVDDPETNPAAAAIAEGAGNADARIGFARAAVRRAVARSDARAVLPDESSVEWANGRGIIGATAALGAVEALRAPGRDRVFDDWTYERLAYRERGRWGTSREVTLAQDMEPPDATWDTVDPRTRELVCVPRSPCPVLFGVRGDDPAAVRELADDFGGEPAAATRVFLTNQGTDAHLRPGRIDGMVDGRGYRIRGRVTDRPTTRTGGHVTFPLARDGMHCRCIAFAPTGRFRNRVRQLRPGDSVIACGEYDDGALKLEKFALVGRSLTHRENPRCPGCDRAMESAGRGQGYRCRACKETAPGKRRVGTERELAIGWYEVPPDARRHLAKPLARGGYDLPVHPTGA